jgi:endoglucanase
VEYRVSSESQDGSFQFKRAGGTPVCGSISFPAAGDWQSWVTISHAVNLEAGPNFFSILAMGGAWNLNWFRITKGECISADCVWQFLMRAS